MMRNASHRSRGPRRSLAPALAQTPPANAAASLVVTVVDTTGAVLPGATVTLTALDAANKTDIAPAQATAEGVATITRVPPGRYSIKAEFAGFETRTLPEVRVRAGNNKQVVMLPVEGHKETVVVGQDKQAAAADPRGPSFGTTLTREQLDAVIRRPCCPAAATARHGRSRRGDQGRQLRRRRRCRTSRRSARSAFRAISSPRNFIPPAASTSRSSRSPAWGRCG